MVCLERVPVTAVFTAIVLARKLIHYRLDRRAKVGKAAEFKRSRAVSAGTSWGDVEGLPSGRIAPIEK
jgi:hypothetical protein